MRQAPKEVIMAGDFNAHFPSWGSPYTCAKGEALTDLVSSLWLTARNESDAPTYERGGHTLHIDVTFASQRAVRQINEWRVLDVEINVIINASSSR